MRKVKVIGIIIFLQLSLGLSATTKDTTKFAHLKVQRMSDSYIDVYYNKPPTDKKMPIMIACQGSGTDDNTEGFLGLIGQFKDKVVGMTIEKEGVNFGDQGDSVRVAYRENNTIYNRLYDYLRVLEYLKAHATWWDGNVYVIGGSEGGLLAGMLASYYPNVKGLAILSFGGAMTFGEAWPIASGNQAKQDGKATQAAIEKEEKATWDSLKRIYNDPVFSKSYSGMDNSYAWWRSIMNLRLQNVLIDLNIPIFVGQGTNDMMVPIESARKLERAFKDAGKTNLFYKEYQSYAHDFSDENGNSHLVTVFTEAITYLLK